MSDHETTGNRLPLWVQALIAMAIAIFLGWVNDGSPMEVTILFWIIYEAFQHDV